MAYTALCSFVAYASRGKNRQERTRRAERQSTAELNLHVVYVDDGAVVWYQLHSHAVRRCTCEALGAGDHVWVLAVLDLLTYSRAYSFAQPYLRQAGKICFSILFRMSSVL